MFHPARTGGTVEPWVGAPRDTFHCGEWARGCAAHFQGHCIILGDAATRHGRFVRSARIGVGKVGAGRPRAQNDPVRHRRLCRNLSRD